MTGPGWGERASAGSIAFTDYPQLRLSRRVALYFSPRGGVTVESTRSPWGEIWSWLA